MVNDPRKSELEREYLRYFPPEPPKPLTQRIVQRICAGIVILAVVLIALELLLSAIFRFM
jgi:hypothetical protein